jgi:CheY-like chemotaxis protein
MRKLGRQLSLGYSARAERARRNELALRLALHTVPMISFEWDIVRDVVRRFDPFDSDVSSSTGMLSRFAAVRDAVHPEDRERFCADIEAALRGETERFETEIRVLSPNGAVAWFRELGIVERDQLGRPLRMIGVAHDITAQRDKWGLEVAPAPTVAASVAPVKTLVIDNDRDAADRLALLLETVGAIVRLAYSGADGAGALNEFVPQLVFLDVSTPYVDVIEMICRIRELPGPDKISLVALSTLHTEDRVHLSKHVGFDALLAKPVGFEALLDLLEKLPYTEAKQS